MESIKKDLKNADGLNFSGEPMSDEAIESLSEAVVYTGRQTQRINKKYIPKKHKKDEEQLGFLAISIVRVKDIVKR
jgi:hypothetical protein